MKKKFFSLLICVAFLFSMPMTAFAANASNLSSQKATTTFSMNEYDALKQLAAQTSATLAKSGYNTTEITAIQNYQQLYLEHIENLDGYSDVALTRQGYTSTQIKGIRNFTGTDAEMQRLGATVTITMTPNFKYTQGGRTTGTLNYTWHWSGQPAIKAADIIAFSWNGWWVTNQSSTVAYSDEISGVLQATYPATYVYPNGQESTAGAGHKITMSKLQGSWYASEGLGSFSLRSDVAAKKDFSCYAAYGHTGVNIAGSIGFSISTSGADIAGGINFTFGTSIMQKARTSFQFS